MYGEYSDTGIQIQIRMNIHNPCWIQFRFRPLCVRTYGRVRNQARPRAFERALLQRGRETEHHPGVRAQAWTMECFRCLSLGRKALRS